MKIQKMKIPAILGALLLAGTLSAGAQMNSDSLYKEPYRPQYHFSPEKGWIGDPSGFMYYQGKYHMYWWGKVESTDLVHYQQITPYAMTGTDDNISYFTGFCTSLTPSLYVFSSRLRGMDQKPFPYFDGATGA